MVSQTVINGWVKRAAVIGTVLSTVSMIMACGGSDLTGNLTLPPEALPDAYWSLDLNRKGINLSTVAPYDTVRLSVTPKTTFGETITNVSAAPVYSVKDTLSLRISSDGLLTALRPVNDKVEVIAQLTIDGITRADTSWVRIISSAPVGIPRKLSIQPLPGDSAKWSLTPLPKEIIPVVEDESGNSISNVLVHFHSSDEHVLWFEPEGMFAFKQGTALVTATTYAFGVDLIDTVSYRITLPSVQFIGISETLPDASGSGKVFFSPDTVTVGVGAVIIFQTSDKVTSDVAINFDDPSAAAGPTGFPWLFYFDGSAGNIPAIKPNQYFGAGRQFNVAGAYRYQDETGNAKGVIVVQQETP